MSDPFGSIREHVLSLFKGGQAFDSFDEILDEVPVHQRYSKARGCGHSPWEVLEHLRFSLQDIVEFSDNADGTYEEKKWPEDYWPSVPPGDHSWEESRLGYIKQLEKLKHLVRTGDLIAPFPWGSGQTLLREALLAADHAAYHLGQITLITRVLKSG